MRAFAGLQEAFAEMGVHIVLDPKVSSYLRPEILKFFEQRVFPEPPSSK
jgi:hypothetical protein